MSCASHPIVHGGASNEAVLETTLRRQRPPLGDPYPSPLPSPAGTPPIVPEDTAAASAAGASPAPDAAAAAALLTAAAAGGFSAPRSRVRAFIKASRAHKAEMEAAAAGTGASTSALPAEPADASGPRATITPPALGTLSSTTYQRYVSTPLPAASSAYTELADANKSILELTDYINVCREAINDLRFQHNLEMTNRTRKTEEVIRGAEARKALADKAMVAMKQERDESQMQADVSRAEVRRLTLDNTRVQAQMDEAVLIQDHAKIRARELSLKLSETEDELSESKIRLDRSNTSRKSLLDENEVARQRLQRFERAPATLTEAEALEAAQKKCSDLARRLDEAAETITTLKEALRATEQEHAQTLREVSVAKESLVKVTASARDYEEALIGNRVMLAERVEELAKLTQHVNQLQQQLETGPAGTSPPAFASPGAGDHPVNRMLSLADMGGGTLGAPPSVWPPPSLTTIHEGRLPGALPGAAPPGATPPPPLPGGPPLTQAELEARLRREAEETRIQREVDRRVAAIVPPPVVIRDDDNESVAGSIHTEAGASRWVEFLGLSMDEQLKMFESSSHKQTIKEVLAARLDPTAERWRRRHFVIEEVVTEWAAQVSARIPHRDAQDSIRQLEKLNWDPKLGDSDREVQAAAWDSARRRIISCFREALVTGCALKRLLGRFYISVGQKNVRVGTYIKSILEDPTLVNSGFAPLAFDVFMYDTDSSYRTANYGQDTAESEWRMLKGRDASEDCVTLGNRVFNAYLQLKDDPELIKDHSLAWKDAGHTESINQKIASCLRDDQSHPERGKYSNALFMIRWNRGKLLVADGADHRELSGLRILKYDVEVDENDRVYATLPDDKASKTHQQSQRRVAGAAYAAGQPSALPSGNPPPPLSADDTRDAANVNPPPPIARGKGDGGRGRGDPGGRGDGRGRGGGRDGGGRGGGKPTSPGVAPSSRAPPPISGHNAEPPPSTTNQGPRSCAQPEGSKGHPQKRAWTTSEWASVLPDFDKIDELAVTTAGHATAQARPADASRTTTRTGRPTSTKNDRDQNEWAEDSCSYCHYRDLAPADVAPGSPLHWWYGTGNGKHSPYRCQCFKRYLAEGGDAAADPAAAPYLQNCLRFGR